jgi:dTDP-4-amino-4,6-dideoxygalactose transaminase
MERNIKVKFLDLYTPIQSIEKDIFKDLQESISTSSYIGGKDIGSFEKSFAEYEGFSAAVGVGNGTDALEILLQSLGLEGKKILVPNNTFFATAEAVTNSGNIPVLIEANNATHTLDAKILQKIPTDAYDAAIFVSLYGNVSNLPEVSEYLKNANKELVVDAAQSHGARINNKGISEYCAAASYSFYPGKNLGALGDAGAILTNHSYVEQRARLISNHGRKEKYLHHVTGRNSRMDTIQAKVLSRKLKLLEDWVIIRNRQAAIYDNALKKFNPICVKPSVRSAYHLYVIKVEDRAKFSKRLLDAGIETAVHYPYGISDMPAGRNMKTVILSKAAENLEKVSLPIGPHLSDSDIEYVCEVILK